MKHISKKIEHFKNKGHSGFLRNVSIALTDMTDDKDPKKRENNWMRDTQNLCTIWA